MVSNKYAVVNLRKVPPDYQMFIDRVDRSTVLGNPFKLDSEAKRDEVVQQYREWLISLPFDSPQWWKIRFLESQGSALLGCWCHPRRCHADVIKEILDTGVEQWRKINARPSSDNGRDTEMSV